MSKHEVRVVKISEIREHTNADTLEIVSIWGYTCCARIGEFKLGDLAAYIEPDTLVPVDQPEFSFLKDRAKESYDNHARIRAVKLRGVVSMGLLIPARPHWKEDDNVMDELKCRHYEPPVRGMSTGGDNAPSPSGVYAIKYDIENYRKYPDVLQLEEPVMITEKIHGANARFVYSGATLHVSSHTQWKKRDASNLWWQAAQVYELERRLAFYPEYVFYGEVYGRVQDLRYGTTGNDPPRLAIFDVMHQGRWLDCGRTVDMLHDLDLPHVPILHKGDWDPSLLEYADGPSMIEGADHIREGCIIKPLTERHDETVGRVILKVVGNDYLTRKTKKR